jgi:hypothetical protein
MPPHVPCAVLLSRDHVQKAAIAVYGCTQLHITNTHIEVMKRSVEGATADVTSTICTAACSPPTNFVPARHAQPRCLHGLHSHPADTHRAACPSAHLSLRAVHVVSNALPTQQGRRDCAECADNTVFSHSHGNVPGSLNAEAPYPLAYLRDSCYC